MSFQERLSSYLVYIRTEHAVLINKSGSTIQNHQRFFRLNQCLMLKLVYKKWIKNTDSLVRSLIVKLIGTLSNFSNCYSYKFCIFWVLIKKCCCTLTTLQMHAGSLHGGKLGEERKTYLKAPLIFITACLQIDICSGNLFYLSFVLRLRTT